MRSKPGGGLWSARPTMYCGGRRPCLPGVVLSCGACGRGRTPRPYAGQGVRCVRAVGDAGPYGVRVKEYFRCRRADRGVRPYGCVTGSAVGAGRCGHRPLRTHTICAVRRATARVAPTEGYKGCGGNAAAGQKQRLYGGRGGAALVADAAWRRIQPICASGCSVMSGASTTRMSAPTARSLSTRSS